MALTVDDFDFPLPPEQIAQHPAAERSGSRMLHVCGQRLADRQFADLPTLLAVLSKYVVLTRMHDGCRNVDLCSSVTVPGRHLLVQKWETPEHQRRHFDSEVMVDMARSCDGLLAAPPEVDLWEATSAHDLR